MKRSWIRLYTKVPHDPKVQRLPAPLFKFWINVLCLTGSEGGPRVPTSTHLSWVLHINENQTKKFMKKLEDFGLIEPDGDGWLVHDWEEYQQISDISTERVRRFRDRSRNVSETAQRRGEESRREEKQQQQAAAARREENRNTEGVLNSGATSGAPEPPPAALPLSQIIPAALLAAAAAPNEKRAQAEKALLLRQNDIRAARNPEGLALIILRDFGITPAPQKKRSANSGDDYNELVAEIARQKNLPR